MARTVRHNDESVKEGYIRNGDKELEVSEELGIAQNVISRLWQRFQDDGNVSRCYSTGRPRITTPNEDRYLAVTAKRKRRNTASDLSRQLTSATGTTVSRQTVYRRLGRIDLYARRPVRCVPLTSAHCRVDGLIGEPASRREAQSPIRINWMSCMSSTFT
ncbi:transposable element Tcb1 transposase [Trichonephila clavipes]|nr:transposable element Tcb1 transposase [Trichonephila clavipes]